MRYAPASWQTTRVRRERRTGDRRRVLRRRAGRWSWARSSSTVRSIPARGSASRFATLNRHGLVAGATGTGKTKTLQALAGQLSDAGVPVLLADVKGDLSGMAGPARTTRKIQSRVKDTGDDWTPTAYPVEFLSLGGEQLGVPIRATLTQFGPILL